MATDYEIIAECLKELDDIRTTAHCIAKAGPFSTPTLDDAWPKFMSLDARVGGVVQKLRQIKTSHDWDNFEPMEFGLDRLPEDQCPCWSCLFENDIKPWWMVVCSICGSKRCPHAKDCRYLCTNSNEPDQVGKFS